MKDTNHLYRQALFTGPDDSGEMYKRCLRTGEDVPESECSRVYVQGLSETNNPGLALIFDRYPTRGGDHFRRPWGPLVREVGLISGSMQVIPEKRWPAFARQQVEALVQAGFAREVAEGYYDLRE